MQWACFLLGDLVHQPSFQQSPSVRLLSYSLPKVCRRTSDACAHSWFSLLSLGTLIRLIFSWHFCVERLRVCWVTLVVVTRFRIPKAEDSWGWLWREAIRVSISRLLIPDLESLPAHRISYLPLQSSSSPTLPSSSLLLWGHNIIIVWECSSQFRGTVWNTHSRIIISTSRPIGSSFHRLFSYDLWW